MPGLKLAPVAALDWPSTTLHLLAKGIVNWLGVRLT